MLKEEEPFHCIRCGKPFGVKSTIERVTAKLEGKHWMFQNSAQRLDVIKMCEDCRVIAITEQEFDPYGAPPRPNVRTTEDYLREREEQERADKTRDVTSAYSMAAARNRVRTSVLEIAYEESGPADGVPVFLMHGWPYDPRTYDDVVPRWSPPAAGRSCPTCAASARRASSPADTPRSGQQAALGNDLKELMDALGIERAVLAGYDWGGRAACVVAALWPERVRGLVSANGYNIQDVAGSAKPASPEQEQRLWYQYYFHTERGRAGLAANRRAVLQAHLAACGRRTGGSTMRPTSGRRRRSTIPTSSRS